MDDSKLFIELLESGKCLYFRLHNKIYCIHKKNSKYNLEFWNNGDWSGNYIHKHCAIDIIKENDITCSLKQVSMWISWEGQNEHAGNHSQIGDR
jgi:hypothetical protein